MIFQVAEEGDCILNLQAIELISQDDQKATILAHLESIMKERDRYANRLYEISSERVSFVSQVYLKINIFFLFLI